MHSSSAMLKTAKTMRRSGRAQMADAFRRYTGESRGPQERTYKMFKDWFEVQWCVGLGR